MMPDTRGRFCCSCAKTVIDFTSFTDKEVQEYFFVNQGKPVCGRFKNNQLHRIVIDLPENIFRIQMPAWMKFLVACLVIFGLSIFPFETTVGGKMAAEYSFIQGKPVLPDKKPVKQKRKTKRKQKTVYDLDGQVTPISMISGYTVTVPDPPPYSSVFGEPTKDNVQKNNIKENISGNSNQPEKKKLVPKPYTPTEFILPAIPFRKRKENREETE